MREVEPFILGSEDVARAQTVAIHNAYNGSIVGEICYADSDDADRACALAQRAFQETRRLSSWERAAILGRISAKLVEHAANTAELTMLEAGKPITDAPH